MNSNLDRERARLRARREQDRLLAWALLWLMVGLAIAILPQLFNNGS